MAISSGSALRASFQAGNAPTSANFADLIDTAIRDTLVAIATAAEGGKTGIVIVGGTAEVSLYPTGPVGLQIISTQSTASALSIMPVQASAATTAMVANHTVVTGKYVAPGTLKYDPFGVRAYASFNSAGTILNQARVSSVAHNAAGSYRVVFKQALATSNYAVAGFASNKDAANTRAIVAQADTTAQARTVSALTIKTYDDAGTQADPFSYCSFAVYCSGS